MAERPPDFLRPPVIETVLGVQFIPSPKFTNAHLGAFWKNLGDGWPEVSDAPPLPQEFERFGNEQVWREIGLLQLKIASTPSARIQIRNRERDRMIQLQNGRFHYNWLGHGGRAYARYPAIRQEFVERVEQLHRFLENSGLGELRPNQWEVTYVNHIPAGTIWSTPADWNRVFATSVNPPPQLHACRLDSVGGHWRYEIEPQRGRLHVELQHGREDPNGHDLLILKLTARGPASPDTTEFSVSGLDLGHEVIVNSFRQMTSAAARAFWEEQS